MNITLEKYLEISKIYNDAWDNADIDLKLVCSGNINDFGLVNDETKKSDAYKNAKSKYDFAFKMVRNFNKSVPNKIKREASLLRRVNKGA